MYIAASVLLTLALLCILKREYSLHQSLIICGLYKNGLTLNLQSKGNNYLEK